MDPKIHKKYTKDKAIFTCLSDKTVKWTFNNNLLPNNVISFHLHGSSMYYLSIREIQWNNSGIYTCTGTYKGKEFYSVGVIRVISGTFRCNIIILNCTPAEWSL